MTDVASIRRRRWERILTSDSSSESKMETQSKSRSQQQDGEDNDTAAQETTGERSDTERDEAIPSEYECILCLRLYHEPVSLPCGHTYCRSCLKRALASKSQCPMCRAACLGSAGECGTNLALVNIIKSQFKSEYAARGKEAEQDAITEAEARRRAVTLGENVTPAPDGSVSMPVCLLDVLFFPNQPVTLHLFERRYIILVNRCLSDTRRFAVFPDRSSINGTAGSVLEISDARSLGHTDEGTFLVMCRSVGRCTAVGDLHTEAGTYGLPYVRVAPLEDDDEAASVGGGARTPEEVLGSDLKQLADRTAAVVMDFMSKLSARQRTDLVRRYGDVPKVGNSSLSSYRKLSFWLPSALSLSANPGSTLGSSSAGSNGEGSSLRATGRGDIDAAARRAAMFRSRSLRQRLSEACEAVMASEAVVGSTSRRRERAVRKLFSPSGTGRSAVLLSNTVNSVILILGICTALWAYQRYSRD